MTDERVISLGEGNQAAAEAGEPKPATPPPETLWVRSSGNLNVGGDVLRRDGEYLVDPAHPKVAALLAAEPPWLIPLPGQGWGDREQPEDETHAVAPPSDPSS